MAELTDKQKAEMFEKAYYGLREAAMQLNRELIKSLRNHPNLFPLEEPMNNVTLAANAPVPPKETEAPEPEAKANAAPQPDPEVEKRAINMRNIWLQSCGHQDTNYRCWSDTRDFRQNAWRAVARFVLADRKELRKRNSKLELVLAAVNDMRNQKSAASIAAERATELTGVLYRYAADCDRKPDPETDN